jgi:endonuclease/exonuclease/phosphatase family metal-dependent hydrolase
MEIDGSRKLKPENITIVSSQNMLSVLTWNALNNCYATPDIRGFPFVDEKVLKKEHRLPRIIEILMKGDYDVICLQEADLIFEIVAEVASKYNCYIHSTENDLAILYKKELLCLEQRVVMFKDACSDPSMSQYFLSVILSKLDPTQPYKEHIVTVVTTHLKAKEGNEEIRRRQIEALLDDVAETRVHSHFPLIIAGDFNEIIDNPASLEMVSRDFSNAYEGFTTVKKREDLIKRQIDYIWHRNVNIVSSQRLGPEEIPDCGLPSVEWPSDHLALVAHFNP